MYLSRIYIKNFKNFEEFDLFIPDGEPLTIIGSNNSGKTNLLKAIRIVLDSTIPPWEKKLTEDDFCWQKGENPWEAGEEIVITLTFSNLKDKEEISSLFYSLAPSELNVETNEESLESNISFIYAPSVFNKVDGYNLNDDYIALSLAGKYHPSGYYYSKDGRKIDYGEEVFDRYACTKKEDFYKYFYLTEDDVEKIREKSDCTFEKGISKQSHVNKIKKHINLLFLDAVRDVKNDFYSGYNSLVSQLFRSSIQDNKKYKISKEISDAFKGLKSDKSIPETFKMIQNIEDRLQNDKTNFLTNKGYINIGTPKVTMENIGRYFNFLINLDEDLKKELEMEIAGLGYQNLAYISAIFALFELKKEIFINDPEEKVKIIYNLLLIEEPEAHLDVQNQKFLHTQIEKKTEMISEINKDPEQKAEDDNKFFVLTQVIQTSHSTHLTSKANLKSVVVMQKNNDKTRAINIDNILKHDPLMYVHKRRILKQYLDATRSALLFAKKVILVEGLSEKYVLGTILNFYLNKTTGAKNIDIDSEGVEIVEVGGKNFDPFSSLYGSEGINNKCLSFRDGDYQLNNVELNNFDSIYSELNNNSENNNLNTKTNIFTFEIDSFFIPNPEEPNKNSIEYLKLILYKFKNDGDYFKKEETFSKKIEVINGLAESIRTKKLTRENIDNFFSEIFGYEVSKPSLSLYLSSLLKAKLLNDQVEAESWASMGADNTHGIIGIKELPDFIIPKYINDGLAWLTTEEN